MDQEPHITICPETGLTRESHPRWTNRTIGQYTYSYTKVDESIVHVHNSGDVRHFDTRHHAALIQEFIQATKVKLPYVELRDFRELTGRGGAKQIQQTKEYVLKNKEILVGFIFCNMPIWVRSISKMGFKAYQVPTKFAACRTYAQAIKTACDILTNRAPATNDRPLSLNQVEFRPDWAYEDPNRGFLYRSGVIQDKLYYTQIRIDHLEVKDVEAASGALEQIFKDGVLKGDRYLRIVDYSGVKKMSIRARREYALRLKHLYKTYDTRPKLTYICGASILARSSIQLFSGFLNQRFKFVPSVEHAFSAVNLAGKEEREKEGILVSPRDINEINELAGMMLWPDEEDRRDVEVEISKENPLMELSETLKVVQDDLAALRQSQARQIQNIETARKEAEAANQAKGDFLANMSHEIRTPMNGVMGMLDVLKETKLDDSQSEYVELARQSARSLLGIVNDILDFSKIESGKMSLESIEFDLGELLESVSDIMGVKADAKEIEFGALISARVPVRLSADPGRLRQVLTNLIKNAITFVEHGRVCVRVTLKENRGRQALLLFEVSDTGIGIPEEKQAQLFDSFTQVDASTTRLYGGTGLGLAISKQLVELMGGKIGMSSQVGKGSKFWFTFPAKVAVDQPPALPWDKKISPRILLKGSKGLNHSLFKAYLSDFNCRVDTLDHPDQIKNFLKKDREGYDLILGDINEMDQKCCEAISLVSDIENLPPIAVLHHAPAKLPLELPNVSFWLSSPLKKSQLVSCIASALSLTSGEPSKINGTEAEPEPCLDSELSSPPPLCRVLLAEDNIVNQKVVMTMLADQNFDVTTAEDGAKAVAAFETQSFDLVLMDIQMPVMGGFEATRQIRALEQANERKVPILALTANAMKGDREKCLAAGMDDYLAKPVQKPDLLKKIYTLSGL